MYKQFNLGHLALLVTAIIFGVGFLFQRDAAKIPEPSEVVIFTLWFVFSRSLIAVLFVLLITFFSRNNKNKTALFQNKEWIFYGAMSGLLFSAGMFFQQAGLAYTSIAKSGFITSLYVILVPILACFFLRTKRPNKVFWLAVLIMFLGLFCFAVSRTDDTSWNFGDTLTLIGAFCFAVQVLVLGLAVKKTAISGLLIGQFASVCLICFLLVLILGKLQVFLYLEWYKKSYLDILVLGLGSSGIAFLLQGYGQRKVPTAHAALILAFEAVFAAIFAYIFYAEKMTYLMLFGSFLMIVAIVVAQLANLHN